MSDWNSAQYLKFEAERTQPSVDLARRVRQIIPGPNIIADLGCGPGNSTTVLREQFPNARLFGIDNSPNMIASAKENHPGIDFILGDVHHLHGRYDLMFSNACLQWIPGHRLLIPQLMESLNPGGVLAVQIPMVGHMRLFNIINEVACDPRWNLGDMLTGRNGTLQPDEYFDILAAVSADFTQWETTYYHRMPSADALVEWVKGARMQVYLHALDDRDPSGELSREFEREVTWRVNSAYKPQPNGEVILHFRRFFFIATKRW
ncbi:hypothetical protein EP30_04435 [Bifidobacterium sp. UTCIF-39]|uniref:methyltransferase domain-containing protein n=1 Tax=Bifidobacterium sp. UTCIF-39 TaxID=1465359 RepID=UPI00112BAAB7|nr:methyltransferase domain-containing protein [Bifidobacterium sp. UTCIF-39]TPF96938.1 hypothetical protein EP30_04435 [Bifidobacterium sp. UTCIF-39]